MLVLDFEHHANLLPWQRRGPVTVLPTAATVAETLRALGAELAAGRYALVAVTGASNVTGESLPLDEVVAAGARRPAPGCSSTAPSWCRTAGSPSPPPAPTTSPSPGTRPTRRSAPVRWSAAATGSTPRPPYLAGGGAVQEVTVEETTLGRGAAPARGRLAERPRRRRAGRGLRGAGRRCPTARSPAHERALRERLVDGLAALPGVRLLRIWADSAEPTGVVSFTVAGADPGLVAAYLSAEHGIGVRDGRFCAHPLLARLGVPDGALRASVGVGSTLEDVDRLVAGLDAFLRAGPRSPTPRWPAGGSRWTTRAAAEPTSPRPPAAPAADPPGSR